MTYQKWGCTKRVLNVFVSSPNDVKPERNIVESSIAEINRGIARRMGIRLDLERWENIRPGASDVMETIKHQLQTCDLFIMIFSRRFGASCTHEGEYKSGTEMEFKVAQELRKNYGKPEIFTYFKKVQDEETLKDPGPELSKVLEFQNKIKNELFYKDFDATKEFGALLKENIISWLCDVVDCLNRDEAHDKKKTTLKAFFDLGTDSTKTIPTKIIYPSVSIKGQQDIGHLLPYMVLEDFLAIHKIELCLDQAGHSDTTVISEDVYHDRFDRDSNLIFVCLPRNKIAKTYLKEIKGQRFELEIYLDKSKALTKEQFQLKWKSKSSKELIIRSPQTKYLTLQRDNNNSWNENPGACTSIDFAIISRFKSPHGSLHMDNPLKIYFIFGIRGLGTWGAARFLDHNPDKLIVPTCGDNPIQHLLQVEYANHAIKEVKDVSEEDQNYFDQQNDLEYIKTKLQNK
jgi:Domain of unknown function (DUF4062)